MRRWLLALVLFALTACDAPAALIPTPTPVPASVTPQVLRVICPESVAPALMALASAYQREKPATQVTVVQRADTLAFQALENGDADVVVLTWLPAEMPEGVWLTTFARDGLAVIVNPQNGIPGLTLEQLRQLFRGRVENWEPWGGLPGAPQVVSREEASGEFVFFQAYVMRDARVSLTALLAPTSESMLQLIGSDPLAVGYLSTVWLDGQVRALTIEGIPPVSEAISAGLYPLTRDLYLATLGDPQGATRDFVQWVLSPPGQDIVSAQRLVRVTQ